MSAQVRTTSWIPTFKQHQTIATHTPHSWPTHPSSQYEQELRTFKQHLPHVRPVLQTHSSSMCNRHLPWSNTSHVSDHCHRRSPHPHATRSPCQGETGPPCTRSLAAGSVGKTPPYQLQQEADKQKFDLLLQAHAPYMFQELGEKTWSWKNTKVIHLGGRIPGSSQNHILTNSTLKRENHRYLWILSCGDLNFCVYRKLPNLRRGRRRSLRKPRFKPTTANKGSNVLNIWPYHLLKIIS